MDLSSTSSLTSSPSPSVSGSTSGLSVLPGAMLYASMYGESKTSHSTVKSSSTNLTQAALPVINSSPGSTPSSPERGGMKYPLATAKNFTRIQEAPKQYEENVKIITAKERERLELKQKLEEDSRLDREGFEAKQQKRLQKIEADREALELRQQERSAQFEANDTEIEKAVKKAKEKCQRKAGVDALAGDLNKKCTALIPFLDMLWTCTVESFTYCDKSIRQSEEQLQTLKKVATGTNSMPEEIKKRGAVLGEFYHISQQLIALKAAKEALIPNETGNVQPFTRECLNSRYGQLRDAFEKTREQFTVLSVASTDVIERANQLVIGHRNAVEDMLLASQSQKKTNVPMSSEDLQLLKDIFSLKDIDPTLQTSLKSFYVFVKKLDFLHAQLDMQKAIRISLPKQLIDDQENELKSLKAELDSYTDPVSGLISKINEDKDRIKKDQAELKRSLEQLNRVYEESKSLVYEEPVTPVSSTVEKKGWLW